jgi:heptaprenyl diphosphate synthase
MNTKKIAKLSMLLSISVVLGLLESLIPIFSGVIPGIKLGLANIVIVYAIYKFSFKDVLYISILRVILIGLLRTGLFSITFFFSLSGAIISLVVMYLVKKYTKLSIVGVSIVGAIFHSIGQIIIAIIFLNNINIIYYLPILLISSVITGIIVGLCADKIIKHA